MDARKANGHNLVGRGSRKTWAIERRDWTRRRSFVRDTEPGLRETANGMRRFEQPIRLLHCNGVRRAAHIDSRDCVEKEKAIAHAFSEHHEALRSFFLGLQYAVLVSVGKKEDVIRGWYLVSLAAGCHDSERNKRSFGCYLANISLFRMHTDKQYRKD